MSDFWYPFYPAVFKADTMHLTAEQDGIYRRLIDHYMETRLPLPDNDAALARISGVSHECFKHASSILRAFFKQKNGMLHHKFCDGLLDNQDKRARKRSQIAQKAANKRWKQNQEVECIVHAESNNDAMLGDATRQDKTRQILSKDNINKGFCLPEWIEETDWKDFEEMRKRIKKPLTDKARSLVVKKLDGFRNQGYNPKEILENSIVNAWSGVFEPKGHTKGSLYQQAEDIQKNGW